MEVTLDNLLTIPEIWNITTKEDNIKLNKYFKEADGIDHKEFNYEGKTLFYAARQTAPSPSYVHEQLMHILCCIYPKYEGHY